MSQQELLAHVARVLDSQGIDWMVTGSVASSIQGEPRSTHDVDLVVLLPERAISNLLAAFPMPDFLLQEEAVRSALRHHSMFNLLSLKDGEKVDFWMLTSEPFDQARFSRKQTVQTDALQLIASRPPRLQITGDRLGMVRFAVRLALQAIKAEDNFFINTYGHIAGSSVLDAGASVEVILTDPPLEPDPEPILPKSQIASRTLFFALGIVVGALLSLLL